MQESVHKQIDRKEMAPPGSPEWSRIVTASKVPVILGMVPQWETPHELWMVMSGLADHDQLDADHLAWGHVAENSLIDWWLHKNRGWKPSRKQRGSREVAYTNTRLPFENQATLDCVATRKEQQRVIECKTSDDWGTWDSTVELPGHIYAQVVAQMGISGIRQASVVGQRGSTVPIIYDVEFDPSLWEGIVDQVHAFVQSLGESEPPQPDPALLDGLKAVEIPADTVDIAPEEVSVLMDMQAQLEAVKAEIEEEKQHLISTYAGRKVTVNGKAFLVPVKGRFAKERVPEEARHLLMDPDVQTTTLGSKKLAKKYPDLVAAATGPVTYTLKTIKEK